MDWLMRLLSAIGSGGSSELAPLMGYDPWSGGGASPAAAQPSTASPPSTAAPSSASSGGGGASAGGGAMLNAPASWGQSPVYPNGTPGATPQGGPVDYLNRANDQSRLNLQLQGAPTQGSQGGYWSLAGSDTPRSGYEGLPGGIHAPPKQWGNPSFQNPNREQIGRAPTSSMPSALTRQVQNDLGATGQPNRGSNKLEPTGNMTPGARGSAVGSATAQPGFSAQRAVAANQTRVASSGMGGYPSVTGAGFRR